MDVVENRGVGDDKTACVALHRELDEHTSDNAREEELEALGLVIVRATSLDVGPKRPGLVRRLQVGHERALATPGGSWGWSPGRMP